MVKPKYHILICTSCRANGQQKGFCHTKNSVEVLQHFIEYIEERDISGEVMITNTGCFGFCEKGPIAVIYPEGIWYGSLTKRAVERIIEEHIEGGNIVEDYLI